MSDLEQREPARSPDLRFRDADAAAGNLARIRHLVPEKVYESLSALLLTAANPDSAVNQFERLAERGRLRVAAPAGETSFPGSLRSAGLRLQSMVGRNPDP